MNKMYGLSKCSTCIKARHWFEQQGLAVTFTDYREHPLAPSDLQHWAQQLGGWPKLVNRASMTWRNLPEERKQPDTDQQWLALIAEFPALVRRPLVVDQQGQVSVGFNEKKMAERFL
ncbi:Spx/MgsR family RNA polymerase-binding regulatory protein [Alcaligenes endophyticus]|uniref:Spx/MgsR family RNA polymerase-binding regulatory protein n=1 Tax=Alcaligenes endophyticus TaxID=1929088 RepID=A0ABT8ENZ9_9BURK|nr:Spx/MgsR family RNA polymerase-binding regulatory protein [Alcaligenes endophyticus]MCX5591309.1 Spx/MgsR family RNA polymerase-binding regulatory protein [Alcaligenes endophyticus]MDN4122810.1 Spx/MgsR family RNA polymerase-binding regulatory protein [Alcaligenes endophyticus]